MPQKSNFETYLTRVMLPVLTASKAAPAPAVAAAPAAAAAPKAEEPKPKAAAARPKDPLSEDDDSDRAGGQSDVQPVGPDYVEEVGGAMTIPTMYNHSD